jgi:transcriptional regulator with XRE-family HTH domain
MATSGSGDARAATLIDQMVGARMKAARRERGLNQEEFASRLGVTFQQIQKYERGVNRVSASRLFKASQILSKPVDWFFADQASRPKVSGEVWEALATKEGLQLMTSFAKIANINLRRRIVSLAKALAEEE